MQASIYYNLSEHGRTIGEHELTKTRAVDIRTKNLVVSFSNTIVEPLLRFEENREVIIC